MTDSAFRLLVDLLRRGERTVSACTRPSADGPLLSYRPVLDPLRIIVPGRGQTYHVLDVG